MAGEKILLLVVPYFLASPIIPIRVAPLSWVWNCVFSHIMSGCNRESTSFRSNTLLQICIVSGEAADSLGGEKSSRGTSANSMMFRVVLEEGEFHTGFLHCPTLMYLPAHRKSYGLDNKDFVLYDWDMRRSR